MGELEFDSSWEKELEFRWKEELEFRWKGIAEWDTERFVSCKQDWQEVLSHLSLIGEHECLGCKVRWNNNNYVSLRGKVCAKCDRTLQPYLSNPINRRYVMQYVNEKYWIYIFP